MGCCVATPKDTVPKRVRSRRRTTQLCTSRPQQRGAKGSGSRGAPRRMSKGTEGTEGSSEATEISPSRLELSGGGEHSTTTRRPSSGIGDSTTTDKDFASLSIGEQISHRSIRNAAVSSELNHQLSADRLKALQLAAELQDLEDDNDCNDHSGGGAYYGGESIMPFRISGFHQAEYSNRGPASSRSFSNSYHLTCSRSSPSSSPSCSLSDVACHHDDEVVAAPLRVKDLELHFLGVVGEEGGPLGLQDDHNLDDTVGAWVREVN